MEYLILGLFTGLSLILAIGAQNIFVIEQGLKKQYIFLVCLICSISDLILIFLGIFLFQYLGNFFNSTIELILNILLFVFLIHFIYGKISIQNKKISFNEKIKNVPVTNIITKTLAFTYLNPHVYSDTVFFLGNFSKNLFIIDKYYFGIGASISSLLFFFTIGYLSKLLSKYLQSDMVWKRINLFIITFMSMLALYVFIEIINFF
jgi:L-lysine exporter family protein LysE/ArgO|tara:strand:+ start:486 stop:1100 length:615 start_codon:yes stop_codon:yes gene_type:complete